MQSASIPHHSTDMDIDGILSSLTMNEIIEAGSKHYTFNRMDKRSRKQLLRTVEGLTDSVQDEIVQFARRKRTGDLLDDERPLKHRRLLGEATKELETDGADISEMYDSRSFMDLPDEDRRQECISAFIDRTGNSALRMEVCVICARELEVKATQLVELNGIPHSHLLCPRDTHIFRDRHLIRGMLLYEPFRELSSMYDPHDGDDSLSGASDNHPVRCCHECIRDLRKEKLPLLAIANNLWLGYVPRELALLTLPERILISRYFPAAYIVKLYPKRKGGCRDTEKLNSGLKGNVSTFRLSTTDTAAMIDGDLMPHSAKILSATIGVTIVGPKNIPERTMPDFLTVRRQRVHDALLWLRVHNPLYVNIIISESILDRLPQNGIPEEVVATTKFSDDTTLLEKERNGYVPEEDDDEESAVALDMASGVMDMELENTVRETVDVPEEPSITSLYSLGVVDVNASDLTDTDILANALRNVSDAEKDGAYAVKRGSDFVNEYGRKDENDKLIVGDVDNPNHLYGAFPTLFPYARGGFEVPRERRIPYESQAHWCLQYADKRFRKDLHFIFQVFGVIQKRQVARSAALQIRKASFMKSQSDIQALQPSDFAKASEEERRQIPHTNSSVTALKKHLSALRVKVQGTDESRNGMRSKIWGMTIMKNPPSIWITINPSDTNDPIAQVLAGADIDMDTFSKTSGSDAAGRVTSIAADPYAAAKFFHFIIRVVLEELFGFTPAQGKSTIKRRHGVLGEIAGYIGTAEAQGRGTLHLHLILWLVGAPSASQMKRALTSPTFRDKIIAYIAANITADIPEIPLGGVLTIKKEKCLSYSRPPDPRKPDFPTIARATERALARSMQVHTCGRNICLVIKHGRWVCKRRAPFELAKQDWVAEDGSWGPKRTFSNFNNWNQAILLCVRSNHDIKLITNGSETKDITWYITNYATKKQSTSSNTSALLAKRLAFHKIQERYNSDCRAVNKKLLQRCANTLTREREFSAPEVISYIMGWGDRFISHHYVTIHLNALVAALKRVFPELRHRRHQINFDSGETNTDLNVPDHLPGEDNTESEVLPLEVLDGRIQLTDEIYNYSQRGDMLKCFNYLEFMLNTYEDKKPAAKWSNARVFYQGESAKASRCRVLRADGHETMPNFVGQWFPRNDDKHSYSLYCALMLMLQSPWTELANLKNGHDKFETTFSEFERHATPKALAVMENIQYYYESSDGSHRRREENESQGQIPYPRQPCMQADADDNSDQEDLSEHNNTAQFTLEDIETARRGRVPAREFRHGETAVGIATHHGIFITEGEEPEKWNTVAEKATFLEMEQYLRWEVEIGKISKTNPSSGPVDERISIPKPSTILREPVNEIEEPGVFKQNVDVESGLSFLNEEQNRVYKIVSSHLRAYLEGKNPPQLLMTVIGPGGAGKSTVINAITALFQQKGVRHLLALTATSGVAASLIGGTTLHWWGGIPWKQVTGDWTSRGSSELKKRREDNILNKEWLITDEVSMLTTTTTALASQVAGKVRGGQINSSEAFGGLNVIFIGDFHQFPPPAKNAGCLYASNTTSEIATLGKSIYMQFETVVILTQQMRIQDNTWVQILRRSREGACTMDDLSEIRRLVLTDPRCNVPDFSCSPWDEAVLVTPRHGVRNLWNAAAIQKHSRRTRNVIYVSNAEDGKGRDREALSLKERVLVAGMAETKTGRLPDQIELTVGMKAMVTWNLATQADLANGTRGEIVDIVLDPRETPKVADNMGRISLAYPPAMVMFKPVHQTFGRLPNLSEGLIPVFPSETTFRVGNHPGIGVKRRQLAITAAYAYTDFKSQGQTIEYVIVDIAPTPSFQLSPFNAYVALSRSRGRSTIRLLRDFDDNLFTHHPSEALRQEDDRLRQLADITTSKVDAGWCESWLV